MAEKKHTESKKNMGTLAQGRETHEEGASKEDAQKKKDTQRKKGSEQGTRKGVAAQKHKKKDKSWFMRGQSGRQTNRRPTHRGGGGEKKEGTERRNWRTKAGEKKRRRR